MSRVKFVPPDYVTREEVKEMIADIFAERDEKERELIAKRKVATIQKMERFNGDIEPEQTVSDSRLKMNEEETIQNIKNIIAILPPNLVENGRHSYPNIRALGGPHLTDEIIDKVYEDLVA